MSHVPKRATQHGVFLPSWEVIPPCLKPGQASVQRQLYGEEAGELAETYVEPDLPPKSVYGKTISSIRKPEDFMDPTRPIRQSQPAEGGGHHGTGHWKSEYRATMNEGSVFGARYHRQGGPSYQAVNPPTCVSRSEDFSAYRDDFCRSRILGEPLTMMTRSVLAAGSPKGTLHIPGYSGFLATNVRNPHVARVAQGESIRIVDKTNLSEQFHANLLGFSGHQPMHVNNCYRGTLNVTSTSGRDFQAPALNAFPI